MEENLKSPLPELTAESNLTNTVSLKAFLSSLRSGENQPYWLHAKNESKNINNFQSKTNETGKFCVFERWEDIYEVWEKKIKPATEAGLLGMHSKVST